MKREIIRVRTVKEILARVFAVLTAVTLFAPVWAAPAAAAKIPAWVQAVEGDTRPGSSQVDEQEESNEELEAWREAKKNVKVPILLYHHITTDEFTNDEAVSLISPTDFRLHMTAIKINFTPISLRTYYNYVMCDDGSITLPSNPIIVTFDDGYLSNYEIAYPILKELEIPATIFIVTDTVGEVAGGGKVNNTHFTWEQAKEMEESGLVEIQSHTVNHVRMTELDRNGVICQLRKSKYMIEKNMGRECDMLAYPYGDYNDEIRTAAREAGYKMQLLVDDKTTEEDYDVNTPSEGVENITRMTIAGSMGNVNVIEIIRRTISKKK